jgi:hypothetical protein
MMIGVVMDILLNSECTNCLNLLIKPIQTAIGRTKGTQDVTFSASNIFVVFCLLKNTSKICIRKLLRKLRTPHLFTFKM